MYNVYKPSYNWEASSCSTLFLEPIPHVLRQQCGGAAWKIWFKSHNIREATVSSVAIVHLPLKTIYHGEKHGKHTTKPTNQIWDIYTIFLYYTQHDFCFLLGKYNIKKHQWPSKGDPRINKIKTKNQPINQSICGQDQINQKYKIDISITDLKFTL